MSNNELVQLLANGYTVIEISQEKNIPTTTLNKKIFTLRKMLDCKTVGHLIAQYLRKKIIE